MKDIYELLSEININSNDVEEIEVSEFEREKGKRKLMNSLNTKKRGKKKIVVAVASLVLISLVSMTIVTPTWAESIPIIGELVQKRLVDVNKQYEDYMNTVGQTKSQEGIDVTFENAVADNNMFTFSFIVKNNNTETKNAEIPFIPISLRINGKNINTSGSYERKAVDDNTAQYLWTIPWNYTELPRYLNVDMEIPELYGKEGEWGVKFSIDTRDLKKNTYIKELENKFTTNDTNFYLDEITISPLTTNIKYYAESHDYNDSCMNFLIIDQDGNECKFSGGTSINKDCKGGEEGKIKSSMNYINTENISSLKLIPICSDKNYTKKQIDSKRIDLDNFSPFKIKLTDSVSIDVENFRIDEENLIVKYNFEYAGKKICIGSPEDFGIKADGVMLKENDDMDLFRKYDSEDSRVSIYKIGKVKDIEMEFYDKMAERLHENEAITVTKK
ncbi:DUF4179 domain-containing protein [Clostridium sp. SHJSY1]|uniref:DUF4179 domain-containing protein n=1 Tax=Clostridium sp. SHJSY1 TaxID=2942483 RepID=UPI002875CED6|nr:DUF4179 domain-containing protein [Clostridium sp. SHJSY1]MDS0525203.1 DUF4179 domain-containing protein [Clostridium sp. SHJSY1]